MNCPLWVPSTGGDCVSAKHFTIDVTCSGVNPRQARRVWDSTRVIRPVCVCTDRIYCPYTPLCSSSAHANDTKCPCESVPLLLTGCRANRHRPGDQHQESAVSANPFSTPQPRISVYTAQEIATLQSRLVKQLGPEYISTRQGPGGGRLHYLAADKVINLANEVFGFNGWSTQIQNVQIDFVDEDPRTNEISLGLSVIVRVTLRDGTFHEDVGYGSMKNCKGKAAAFEKAKKEGVTDALKRALRNFGNVLGNCLYDKDYLQKVSKIKVAPTRWDADNLHRHADFAPIKKESISDADERQGKEAVAQRQSSLKSVTRTDSIEFDDDFGGGFR